MHKIRIFTVIVFSLLSMSFLHVPSNIIQESFGQNQDENNTGGIDFIIPGVSEGKRDVTGSYNNSGFGIEHISIPQGWYGNEISINNSLIFTMTPEKQSEFIDKVMDTDQNEPSVTMTLAVNDIAQIEKYKSESQGSLGNLSYLGIKAPECNPIEENSTKSVNGITFKTYANECTTSLPDILNPSFLNNSNSTSPNSVSEVNEIRDAFKTYEYKTPSKVYSFVVSIENPSKVSDGNKELSDYFETGETTVSTLRLR
jgi:hypothetical protein